MDGISESELIALGPCAHCGKKLFEGATHGLLPFYVVTVQQAITDPRALQRRVGLGMQIGEQLARVMGPDEDLAKLFMGPTKFFLHQDCAFHSPNLLVCVEIVNDRVQEKTE